MGSVPCTPESFKWTAKDGTLPEVGVRNSIRAEGGSGSDFLQFVKTKVRIMKTISLASTRFLSLTNTSSLEFLITLFILLWVDKIIKVKRLAACVLGVLKLSKYLNSNSNSV